MLDAAAIACGDHQRDEGLNSFPHAAIFSTHLLRRREALRLRVLSLNNHRLPYYIVLLLALRTADLDLTAG